jgi:PAS domain-containing protein
VQHPPERIETENELRRIVDAIPGFVWTSAPDGNVDFLNQRWCEYTGLSFNEACDVGWQTTIHPKTGPNCSNAGNPFGILAWQVKWKRDCGTSMAGIDGSFSGFLR